jgi:hypothetical protein
MSGERCCAWATGYLAPVCSVKPARDAFIGINPTIQKKYRSPAPRETCAARFISRVVTHAFSFAD